MYSSMKPQRGKTPGTAKKAAPKRPAPKPPTTPAVGATDPVEVFCRIRPIHNADDPVCIKVIGAQDVILTATENSHAARLGGALKETKYSFRQVFDDCCPQKAVFEQVALPLVEEVLHGQNALLFAYGITSSGKTYTMMGESQDPGILPRSLDVIFNSIHDLQANKYVFKPDKMNGFDVQTEVDAMLERQHRELMPKLNNMNQPKTPAASREKEDDANDSSNRRRDRSRVGDIELDNNYAVFLSYVEIYNKYIYDLLEEGEYDPITLYKPPTSKGLREDNNHNMYVNGVVEVEVKSTEEAYEVLEKGQKRRRVAHTSLNSESSRSHSVLNIRVVQAPLDNQGSEVIQDKDKVCISQLSLVDLAGSERASRTGNQGDRIREAGNINNALMHLRSCIEVLRENQRNGESKYVPYRYDRMTHLFKNYFEGEGKVRMIVCVNPKAVEYDETVNVMKFAMMTQEVQVCRSEKKEFDLGLIHGRRQLKDQLREEAERAKAERALAATTSTPMAGIPSIPMIYSFQSFPHLELMSYDDDSTLPELARYLQDRINQRIRLMKDYTQEEQAFRSHLLELEQEHNTFKEHNHELKSLVKTKDSEISRLEKKLRNLEKAYESMNRKNTSLERVKNTLEREVGERDYRIQMVATEKNRLEQDNKHRINWLEKNFNKKVEMAKSQAAESAVAKLRCQEKKLAKVRNLLESDTDSTISSTPLSSRNARYMAKSETDLTASGKVPVPTPRSIHSRAMTTANMPMTRQVGSRTLRSAAPPPTKPKPNLKYHRRSKSSHEVYLDHNPSGSMDPKSVLTPGFKKARSVTKLDSKDMKGMDKYLLTTMDVDSEGDQATKMYKGEVLRTSSGGKSVVFNDVEVLKHKSPGDRKRKSDEYPDEYADDTEIEDRCRIAVEGHNVNLMNLRNKRVKQSQV